MNYLTMILGIIGDAVEAAKTVSPAGEVQSIEEAGAALSRIAAQAAAAHQAITGKPIDLTQLTPLPPVA